MARCGFRLYHLFGTVFAMKFSDALACAGGACYRVPLVPAVAGRLGVIGNIACTAHGTGRSGIALLRASRRFGNALVSVGNQRCNIGDEIIAANRTNMFSISDFPASGVVYFRGICMHSCGRGCFVKIAALFTHRQHKPALLAGRLSNCYILVTVSRCKRVIPFFQPAAAVALPKFKP